MKKLAIVAALAWSVAWPLSARADFATYDEAVTAARAKYEAGEYVAARAANDGAAKLATTQQQKFDTQLRIGKLDLAEKKPVAAREKMQRALQMATDAEQKITVLLLIGQAYRDEKDYSTAIATWQQVLALPDLDSVPRSVAEVGIAGAYLDDEKFALSRQWLTRVIADPQANKNAREMAIFIYAVSYVNEKDEPKARVELAKVVANADIELSLRANAQNMIGQSYFDAADYSTARQEFAKTATLGVWPSFLVVAQTQIIESYRRENNPQAAQKETTRFQMGMMQNATTLMKTKQGAAAREYFRAAIAVELVGTPSVMALGIRAQIAQSYLSENNPAQARQELAPILEQDKAQIPEADRDAFRLMRQSAQLSFALSYAMDGDKKRSREELNKLLQMPELNPGIKTIAEQRLAAL